MTFLELTRKFDDLKIRVNMEHVSEYFTVLYADENCTRLTYEDGKQLDVKQEAEYIDGKIREIEEWRMNARRSHPSR